VDPGEMKICLAYDPLCSEYQALAAQLAVINGAPPNWKISFPDADGSGSGVTTETFHAHIISMSREVKKESFLVAEVGLKLTGNAGLKTS
jgi:hypothetical protein